LSIPALLAVEFLDAPVISSISGRMGETEFGWELAEFRALFEFTNADDLERRVSQTISDLSLIAKGQHRQLLAAIYYFSVASRLLRCGNGPWEFMAETVLNWTKALVALFGTEKHDVIRTELTRLGVVSDIVERYFVPVVILRNHFDVSHVSLSLHKASYLKLIYEFLSGCEEQFRHLFRVVLEGLRSGALTLASSPALPARYATSMTRFLEILRARGSVPLSSAFR
jgi:hypothetical protein